MVFFCSVILLCMNLMWDYNCGRLYLVALSYLYVVHLLFVDMYRKNADLMASHHFCILSRVSTSRFREDKCLVN